MDKNSSSYVVVFAVGVCVAMAFLLSGTFEMLKSAIAENELFDKQRNVLKACGLYDPAGEPKTKAELQELFNKRVTAKVLELREQEVEVKVRVRGEVETVKRRRVAEAVPRDDLQVGTLHKARRAEPDKILRDVYIAETADGKQVYCVPISGYGLWSTLYGFLALEADLNTVKGITFYKHGETPGLGGEVEAAWWTSDWPGKTIRDESGEIVGIKVLKGRGNKTEDGGHEVDGISGATITADGVTEFVRRDLESFEPWFKKLRN